MTAARTSAAADDRPSHRQPSQGPIGIIAPLLVEGTCIDARPRPGAITRCGPGLVHVCGMGHERASAAAEALIEAGCSLLVSFGTAGALVPGLVSGDILLTAAVQGSPAAEGHGANMSPLSVMQSLKQRLDAAERLRVVDDAILASSREVLVDRASRESFARRTRAIAVDMESGAIAAVAEASGVPFIALRSIVDTLEGGLPHGMQEHVDAFGQPRWSLAGWAIGRPWRLLALASLGLRMSRARRSLRSCARALLAVAVADVA